MTRFEANARQYVTSPGVPVVVICVDGSEPDYHLEALRAGAMPWLAQMLETGTSWPARCAMPALTNPNNVSIATGVPPSVHGICGNYFLDPATGHEVVMNDPSYLRAPTLFAAAEEAGLRIAVVTAKDKLRRLLGAGLESGTCWSAEAADPAVEDLVGRARPGVYSADLSEFVLATGVRLVERGSADLFYLSLSDYVQHKHAPGTSEANAFYAMLDRYAARLDGLGAVLVITADHGMSAKTGPDGAPRIIWLEDEVRRVLEDSGDPADAVRVVLPITDPYLAHHGALGSFASVHLPDPTNQAARDTVLIALRELSGIEQVHDRETAADRFALPADRIGDLVVLAEASSALGTTPAAHDLAGLDAPLRSHGALGEIDVPFLVNRSLPEPPPEALRNYDAFWVATTLVARSAPAATGAPG